MDGPDDVSDKTVDKPMRPSRDEVYYFQQVIFQIGITLFRVPRNAFDIPGTIFEAMFALPPTPDAEGSTDENPIVLQHVDENYFRGFLRVICGPRGQEVPDEDWLMALDLATLWTFDDIRRMAIQALEGWARLQSLKQVILTAKKYNIGSWLEMAYTQLVFNKPLPFDVLTEPPAVDWETIARLLYAQYHTISPFNCPPPPERWPKVQGDCCSECGQTDNLCCGYIDDSVKMIFKAEIERMQEKHFKDPALPEDSAD